MWGPDPCYPRGRQNPCGYPYIGIRYLHDYYKDPCQPPYKPEVDCCVPPAIPKPKPKHMIQLVNVNCHMVMQEMESFEPRAAGGDEEKSRPSQGKNPMDYTGPPLKPMWGGLGGPCIPCGPCDEPCRIETRPYIPPEAEPCPPGSGPSPPIYYPCPQPYIAPPPEEPPCPHFEPCAPRAGPKSSPCIPSPCPPPCIPSCPCPEPCEPCYAPCPCPPPCPPPNPCCY